VRVEVPGSDGILERRGELSHLEAGGGPIGVEDVVVGIQLQGLGVESHRLAEVPRLARCIALADELQEQGSARRRKLRSALRLHLRKTKLLLTTSAPGFGSAEAWIFGLLPPT